MIGTELNPRQFLDRVAAEFGRVDVAEIQKLADLIHERYLAGRFVFVIGNGGSGSNASHFCEDMGKGTLAKKFFDDDSKKRLKILSLTDNTPILAWATIGFRSRLRGAVEEPRLTRRLARHDKRLGNSRTSFARN